MGAPDAVNVSRNDKIQKYDDLANELATWQRFDRVTVAPLVTGSLGSWNPKSDKTLK